MKRTTAEMRELAAGIKGPIWTPRINVERYVGNRGTRHGHKAGWYWRDMAESPADQWRGPFKSERAAWAAALDEYEVPY